MQTETAVVNAVRKEASVSILLEEGFVGYNVTICSLPVAGLPFAPLANKVEFTLVSPVSNPSSGKKGSSTSMAVAIAVPISVCVVMAAALALYMLKRQRELVAEKEFLRQKELEAQAQMHAANGLGTWSGGNLASGDVEQQMASANLHLHPALQAARASASRSMCSLPENEQMMAQYHGHNSAHSSGRYTHFASSGDRDGEMLPYPPGGLGMTLGHSPKTSGSPAHSMQSSRPNSGLKPSGSFRQENGLPNGMGSWGMSAVALPASAAAGGHTPPGSGPVPRQNGQYGPLATGPTGSGSTSSVATGASPTWNGTNNLSAFPSSAAAAAAFCAGVALPASSTTPGMLLPQQLLPAGNGHLQQQHWPTTSVASGGGTTDEECTEDSFDRVPEHHEQLLINAIEMSRELQVGSTVVFEKGILDGFWPHKCLLGSS